MKTKAPLWDESEFGSSVTVCPSDKAMLKLLGGCMSHHGVRITSDQYNQICKWADINNRFDDEDESKKLLEADAVRCAFTEAEAQGSRMVAFVAKFLEKGEDPVQWLSGLLYDAGYDVECWEDEEDDEG